MQQSIPTVAATGPLWGEYGRRVRLIERLEPFQGLGTTVLAHLATALQPSSVAAGAIIYRAGDPVERLYLVESGTILVSIGSGDEQQTLTRWQPGDYFGETALFGSAHSTTTTRAENAATLWALPADELRELCQQVPAIEAALLRTKHLRLADERLQRLVAARGNLAALLTNRQPLRIGHAPENELVLASTLVSRQHALLEPTEGGCRLHDIDSYYGTWVNGQRIDTIDLHDGDQIRIGGEHLTFDRRAAGLASTPRGIRIEAHQLSKQINGGKRVLNDISLAIAPGELVAIIGGSGAGKSTLLDALAGVRPATSGTVTYNEHDYYANRAHYRPLLGYVPQDDIIHTALPLRRTLQHAAKLRLPPDTSDRAISEVVGETLDLLGLTAQAETRVHALSGGQRKRCSIGVELLTRPRVFFLDEPTSGLDPATETQLMQLLRQLADSGSTVVLTTHATSTLGVCDKAVVLARGGELAFFGTPQRALRFFKVGSFAEIYTRLADQGSATPWSTQFRAAAATKAYRIGPAATSSGSTPDQPGETFARRLRRGVRQFGVLTGRTWDLLLHSRTSVVSLLAPPLLITLLLALFRSGAFGDTPNPTIALQTLLFFGYGALFFGLTAGLQEITKELAIFRRERTVNLGIVPYLASKLAVLTPIMLCNTLILTGILLLTGRLPTAAWAIYGRFLPSLGLNALVGLSLGLLISAAVPTSEVATRLQSLVLIPQIIFSGGLVAVAAMGNAGQALSAGTALRWGFEALGKAVDLNALFARSNTPAGRALLDQYQDAFAGEIWPNWLVVIGFIAVSLLLTGLILRRKGTPQ